ncbi:hypothetical protein [Geodermatophilus obscurus]|uniref:Uncharacterized protein n=1 Tax=Geodermatophilus obscurus (strain ATCC 25078 / DSM 43160 / JCM 3152 / CCUG 61914 / KCC A-0152 / KCTC 9177 / NBRC 13315 / NRRL B-3577 / G-20) TaxID=526225 RepID=D2S890_GEOOG|nr:hypothetical protein [Geodermatophilus obscurus]ADB73512.1 hypothetical protein Gobs_0742 [Geodermatophilus obscurus DSM 43160]
MTTRDPYDLCSATPAEIFAAEVCLYELSKDAEGQLSRPEGQQHVCPEDDCRTLTTDQDLELSLRPHDCDSDVGRLFDGELRSVDLATVYVDGDGTRRGMHTATFSWRCQIGLVQGTLAGLTNEGTHRAPVFDECQRCGETGVMEGRLCGRLVRSAEPRLAGAQVVAAYRLRFDSSREGALGGVRGTLEGLVVRTCEPRS